MSDFAQIKVQLLPTEDASAEELSNEAVRLRRELLELQVNDVQLDRETEAPLGTKAADAANLGHLLVTAIPSSSVLGAIVAITVNRLKTRTNRSARLELDGDVLELKGLGEEEQRKLVEQWLQRQERGQ